ncbi:MAG: dihydroxyacetone kinase subunit DhaL [Pseudomonadota bacterium]
MGTTGSADLIRAFNAVAASMEENRDHLCALDGVIGDADHGVAMELGFSAVRKALAELGDDASPTDVFNTAARAFLNAVGASSGPLYATAFMRAGAALKGKSGMDDTDAPEVIAAMAGGIAHRGKASPGDKTMLDAWTPAAEAATAAQGQAAAAVFAAAAKAAADGAETTKGMQAKMGRAARLGERAVGHVDPGAASAALVIAAFAGALA